LIRIHTYSCMGLGFKCDAIFNTQYHCIYRYAVFIFCSDAEPESQQRFAYVDIGCNREQQLWHKLPPVWRWS
jgi:hypothetical protein